MPSLRLSVGSNRETDMKCRNSKSIVERRVSVDDDVGRDWPQSTGGEARFQRHGPRDWSPGCIHANRRAEQSVARFECLTGHGAARNDPRPGELTGRRDGHRSAAPPNHRHAESDRDRRVPRVVAHGLERAHAWLHEAGARNRQPIAMSAESLKRREARWPATANRDSDASAPPKQRARHQLVRRRQAFSAEAPARRLRPDRRYGQAASYGCANQDVLDHSCSQMNLDGSIR
jgi:hypothetical protein